MYNLRLVGQNGVLPGARKPQNLHFSPFLTPSGVIFRYFGAQGRNGPSRGAKKLSNTIWAPRGAMGPRSALCFYLLRGKVKQCYMFSFVLLASTLGAQRRKANLSCADIHAVIFWLQPTWKQVLRFEGTRLSLFAFAACASKLLLLEVFIYYLA